MRLSEFDYELPKELIAKHPLKCRSSCRLLVLDRESGTISHRVFSDITEYFKPSDCLVLNNTKVIPARLFGKRKSGGAVEIFLMDKEGPVTEALVRPSARIREGERIVLESGDEIEVCGAGGVGRMVRFFDSIDNVIKRAGHIPLPPYIDRMDEPGDAADYQTVFARKEGATASPTAGLHFTSELLSSIAGKGVTVSYVTLHTNYGTFAPIKREEIEEHKMHKEYFEISYEAINDIRRTKQAGGRVFAVGTTSCRVMESCADAMRIDRPAARAAGVKGYTDLYMYPGREFQITDALITNFHLPRSTLMILVSAFAGRELIMKAYREAIKEKYRFFSYGDAMLIL